MKDGDESEVIDALILYGKKLAREERRWVKKVQRVDMNRRWRILQYLWKREAFEPTSGVTSKEIARDLDITVNTALVILNKLRKNKRMVEKVGRKNMKWFLTQRGIDFAQKWGGFLNHPWISKKPRVRRVTRVRVK